jgi:hypothetical protein
MDKLVFTNIIFLVSKLEVPMINKKNIIFANTQVKKMAKFERKQQIRVITKLPNSEQSYKGKVKTHKYINRQNQSTTGKL